MMSKKKYLMVCIALFMNTMVWSQDAGFELLQVLKIAERYKHTPNLNYNLDITYADSILSTNILEQMTGVVKVSYGKYWTYLDSVEMVQGHQYSLSVYHTDSTIIVNDKSEYGDLMKLSFLDSVFTESHVHTMTTTQVNDTTTKLDFYFYSSSPYTRYTLTYNPVNFLVREIKYYVKDNTDVTNISSGIGVFTIAINNYSTIQVDQSIFREDRFIYKLNGQFLKKPAYTGFTLINNSIN